MKLLHLHLCSPFLWAYGCPPGSSCLWSRWMPPTSWSGLEDAGGPEEEGDEEGRESERRRRERDAGVSTCRDWSSAGPHGNRAEADAASGWAWRYLRFTHTSITATVSPRKTVEGGNGATLTRTCQSPSRAPNNVIWTRTDSRQNFGGPAPIYLQLFNLFLEVCFIFLLLVCVCCIVKLQRGKKRVRQSVGIFKIPFGMVPFGEK